MQVTNQKKMAAKILKCGVNRIWVDPRYVDQVTSAVQKSDIRELIEEGLIKARPIKGTSRVRARKLVAEDTVLERVVPMRACQRRIDGCAPFEASVEPSRVCAKMAHLKQPNTVTTTVRPRVDLTVPSPT